MLVGDRASALAARGAIVGTGVQLTPRPLSDGRYALPEVVRTAPGYEAAVPSLTSWSTATPAPGDYTTDGGNLFIVRIGGRSYYHTNGGAASEPASDVLRFDCNVSSASSVSDSIGGSRRSEFVCTGTGRGVGVGTVWVAFTLILGPHEGMVPTVAGNWGLVHQWHSVDNGIPRSPVLAVGCASNALTIITRSSASMSGSNGVQVTHHTQPLPAQGQEVSIVLQATFGQVGHLNAWIDGAQVVNADTPIGYYTDLTDGSGRTELGYPHFGLYQKNHSETDVVYIANPEWGTDSLASRIAAPTAVPDLNPWS